MPRMPRRKSTTGCFHVICRGVGKQILFEEERELTVVLLVDVSSSSIFGTSTKTKRELVAEIAAVLSFSASINNDKVGALFFSSKVEKFIHPKKGRSHLLKRSSVPGEVFE